VKQVQLTTDGSCLGNPGPGGWACILRFGAAKKELFGYHKNTTNNRMEMMAAIQGLLALKEPCQVEVTTDAQYLLEGATKWIIFWKRRHWWKRYRPIRNVDLWMELDRLMEHHQTTWTWTKGHASHEDNNRCDCLATNAAANQISSWPDRRPYAELPLNLGSDYIPPNPQGSLFGGGEEDDEEDPG
jgi:ribonuclease HI